MRARVARRRDKIESLEAQRRLGLRKTGLGVAGPEPTRMSQVGAHQLLARQQGLDVCGYYYIDKDQDKLAAWKCHDQSHETMCNTIGSVFGCGKDVPSACYPSTKVCPGSTRDLCCDGKRLPSECMTGIKTVGGRQITAYFCSSVGFVFPVFDFAGTPATAAEMDDEGGLTTVVVTIPVTATAGVARGGKHGAESTGTLSEPRTASAASSSSTTGHGITNTQEPGGTQHGPSTCSVISEVAAGSGTPTPFGAIVGGVIGGVAVMAFVAFALWYVRFQKRRAASGSVQGGAALGGSSWQNLVVVEDRSIPNAVKPGSPLSLGELQ